MATLEKIRSRSVLLVTVIAVALLLFIIGDFVNNSSAVFNEKKSVLGEVGGKQISIADFQKQVSVMSNVFKMSGQNQVTDGDVREAAWSTFVRSSVVESEAGKAGFSVTAMELKDNTLGDNVHPMMRQIPLLYNENQQFDPQILYTILSRMDDDNENARQLKDYWMFWENAIKDRILEDKYLDFAMKAMSAPKAETEFLNKLSGNDIDMVFACKKYSAMPDSSFVPSENDLKKKYEEMKQSFKTDGYRIVKSIVFNVSPSEEDFEQAKEKVVAAENYLKTVSERDLPYFVSQESDMDVPYVSGYRSASDIDYVFKDFAFSAAKDSVASTVLDAGSYKTAKVLSSVVSRPDSVKVTNLVVGGRTIEEARATADSLMAVIKAGADFSELIAKHSADPSARQNGGDWGWIREGQFGLDTFDNVVFSSKLNEVSKIETPQAILLVKVTDRTAPVKKVRLAVISNKVEPSNDTYRAIYEKANSFIATNNTLEKFLAAAQEQSLLVRDLGPLAENQSDLYVLDNGRPIVKWAFENKLGTVCTKPFDAKYKYVVVAVSDVVEKGYSPMTASFVKDRVSGEVIKAMKAAEIKKDMENVSDLSSLGSVDSARVSFNQAFVPGYGLEPSVVAAAFSSAENSIVSPIVGENGVFAIKVVGKSEATPMNERRIEETIRSIVRGRMIESMVMGADLEDNRSVFY